jgi:hypothetical protein
VHKEIEEARETHANDRIPGAALAIAINFELMVQQASH